MTRLLAFLFVVAALGAGTASAGTACVSSCSYAAPAGSGALLVFNGHGWGHGVGMSQYGAYGYAQHGSTYDQILAHYYPGTSLSAAPAKSIRVLLADKKKQVTISADARFTVRDGTGAKHAVPAGPLVLKSAKLQWPAPLTVTPAPRSYLTLGKEYRGTILVDLVDGKLRAIDIVGLEQYLWGVVPAEMPSSWAPEALKAQAVAARSYALATRAVGAPFDVYSDTRSQMYLGVTQESPTATAAVEATKGKVLLYGGKVATTFFYSTSGGQTESSADWTGTSVPYLVSVPDPYDALSPYHDWGPVPVTATALLKSLKLAGPVLDVTTTPNQAGRVAQLKLTTPLQALAVPASQLRSAIGLRSTWFTVGLLSLTPPQPATPVVYGSKVTLASVVRGFSGVTLEQKPAGADWQPARTVNAGSTQLAATPTVTTDYRLATTTVAAGSVRIKVMPLVTLTTVSSTQVAGAIKPVLPDVEVDVQQLNVDQTWTTVASGRTLADGTFSVAVGVAGGVTVRAVVTPPTGYAPGVSTSQVVSG